MASNIITKPTSFMKGLSKQEYDAILSDVQKRIKLGKQGLAQLKSAIFRNSDPALKKAFTENNNPKKLRLFIYDNIEDGYDSLGFKIDSSVKNSIKDIYKNYFAELKKAGQNPEYTVDHNDNKSILIFDTQGLSAFSGGARKVIYDQMANYDVYAAKAVLDYSFRHILDNENFSEAQFIKLQETAIHSAVFSFATFYGDILRETVAGTIGSLQAIEEKLSNYVVGSDNFSSNPISDATDLEDSNVTILADQFNKTLSTLGIDFSLGSFINEKYKGNVPKTKLSEKYAYKVLEPSEQFKNIKNSTYAKTIFDKLFTSGLMDLIASVGEISTFAQKRFSVGPEGLKDPEKSSAANALDAVRDTIWLQDLSNVITNLTRDPLSLAIIQEYFPNVATLFFAAATAASDYSGGSDKDPINSPEAQAEMLLKAFGVDENGQAIFKPAWEMINTQQRIKAALDKFPFRENIPPRTPDVFHFRLGAANFYVPPVAINVSSQFKTGSMTGGAIRQKNSPKFNAGYKETTINMKLFFPNYEEIWGINIDGIKDITLDKDFKIDFKGSGNEEQIDKFLSSLRGLVAAFKYAPILPVKNHYLNTVHGISGVALSSMSISTIPNYPFALVVDLELLNFNHKPFLPMIKDFNQAVHWGKFRHYMGKAAGNLHAYINESFFIGHDDNKASGPVSAPGDRGMELIEQRNSQGLEYSSINEPDLLIDPFKEDIYKTNIIKEWRNGNNISLFIPTQVQTKIFTPDVASFRSDEERMLDDTGQAVWESMLKSIGIDINQSASYGITLDSVISTATEGAVNSSARRLVLESFDLILAGKNKSKFDEKVYDYYVASFVLENKSKLTQDEIDYMKASPSNEPLSKRTYNATTYTYTYVNQKGQTEKKDLTIGSGESSKNMSLYDIRQFFKKQSATASGTLESIALNLAKEKADSTGKSIEDFKDQAKTDVARAFNVLFYNRFFKSGPIQKIIENKRLLQQNYQFNEWEVPMSKVDLDPKACIVDGISVTLANNLAKMQLQMQEEPTYQHIGGKDSYLNISMTVFGEKELIKLRKIFEHINGLARLEHSTGVIGFMGIKNIVAGLSGIKYVVPLSYQVDTIPNYPHVYSVRISFVDFDIFQQKREQLSSKQQREMVETFGTKRNPFLRIKQLWGSFNAYPDFPLSVKNENNEVVGQLDPDYYFRAFEMLDSDIVNHVETEQDKINNNFITKYSYDQSATSAKQKETNAIIGAIKGFIQNNDVKGLKNYFDEKKTPSKEAGGYVQAAINEFFKGQKPNLLMDFINEYKDYDSSVARFTATSGVGFSAIDTKTSVGDVAYSSGNEAKQIQKLIQDENIFISDDGFVGINPDELSIHHIIEIIPASENVDDDKIPAWLRHASGYHLGYVSKKDNRFYFTTDSLEQIVDPKDPTKVALKPMHVGYSDVDEPARAYAGKKGAAHLSALGSSGSNLGETMNGYSAGDKDVPETMTSNSGSLVKHWERMLLDTQYRDVSGRMIRAFPTYMLWLIDEGGYFAGVKMFDNFYGLQSIIDFSIVQSEDILGDTLIFRVSNLYSKLTTPESTNIFGGNDEEYGDVPVTQTDGLESVLDTVINRTRNIQSGMMNDYIVDINNIRLKPGVRVHLRAGYGSNPNALQTVFNGIITQVENGEIVTVTAQSDAIELSPVINSTNKKGDSGKIDGGINTGLWLSEPRDLMVRLLSMGSSRFRESLAHATRGKIFSENKFGIRHFGSILYEPLTPEEQAKNDAVMNSVKSAFDILGEGSGATFGMTTSMMGVLNSGERQQPFLGVGPELRVPGVALMQTLWANFSSQRDFEVFKRNIYPGNGTGIAQFLGGDLGDGWSSVASITPEDRPNERLNYIGRVTDYSWNNLTASYSSPKTDAKSIIDGQTSVNTIKEADASGARVLVGGAVAVAGTAALTLGAPIVGGIGIGAGLLGVLSGRAGNNIFNAMGITSGLDDDLPGLDEVSFRAQTYMRSVWDIFQLCARLLPNYIVAIRPFEDRSTVFYGKPHWLYTSGVVPLTTGYPAKDLEGSSNGPQIVEADAVMAKALQDLNKVSNPLADAAAFSTAKKSLISISEEISNQLNPGDDSVYIPKDSLNGKIIYFGTTESTEYKDEDNKVVSRIPNSSGYATIGYHLPVIKKGSTEKTADPSSPHAQIAQLTPKYRYPFFTEREDDVPLEDYAYYALNDRIGKWNNHQADYMKLAADYEKKKATAWIDLLKLESSLTSGVSTVDYGIKENVNGEKLALSLNKQSILDYSNVELDASAYIYSEKRTTSSGSAKVRMPYPKSASANDEWGAPDNEKDEQFYIAMKWPYSIGNSVNPELRSQLQASMGYDQDFIAGTVDDYKQRKVLVYSPTTGRAVVCKPAYYLWGKDEVSILAPNTSSVDNSSLGIKDGVDQFGNTVYTKVESGAGTRNSLALGKDVSLSAIVSPDAAYYLGMMNLTEYEKTFWSDPESSKNDEVWGGTNGKDGGEGAILKLAEAGIAPFPIPRLCYYSFVPDSIPVGVVPDITLPVQEFARWDTGEVPTESGEKIIGFGRYVKAPSNKTAKKPRIKVSQDFKESLGSGQKNGFYSFEYDENYVILDDGLISSAINAVGGNLLPSTTTGTNDGYFDLVKSKQFDKLSKDSLKKILDSELKNSASAGGNRVRFASVYNELDDTSRSARALYDQDYDLNTEVLAGNGRTLQQASEIWDQFRSGYHTYTNVKEAFQKAYGLDPDSTLSIKNYLGFGKRLESMTPEQLFNMRRLKNLPQTTVENDIFKKFGSVDGTAKDEFDLVFGDYSIDDRAANPNYVGPLASMDNDKKKNYYEAIEFSRTNFTDASEKDNGLIEYFNSLIKERIESIISVITQGLLSGGIDQAQVDSYIKSIETPQQLFYFIVGSFRNAMWSDPYARAWLVLKPNRKLTGDDHWDFNPVLKIFQAYIDPNNTFAKDKNKFKKLLAQNRGEGSGATNIFGRITENVDSFVDQNIGPIISGLGDALSGLINIFRMSMMQLGYGLSNIGQMSKQANVLNKVLNDSIYYSLGRPGSLLRAVDNPFTREYGEPVVEIREPFQRIHYLSSFSHIISNGIQENINGVATSVTAVSDGKYPVTVALDKSMPSERQVEKTIETGIYFDNATGSGLFGALHPILHPFETIRGISKFAQGTPDELLARRVGLAHLKESLKDIYGGEIVIVGNADIRPHDLVYLADVYERMYGLFEVEQVVHHFTSELGFITSITPNALVTVNDPARWFMSSWIGTWLHMQALRNDTRLYMNSAGLGAGITGEISVDGLADSLNAQMVGGIQYSHGASAITKDVMAHFTATGVEDINDQVKTLVKQNSAVAGGQMSVTGIGGLFAAATGLGATAGAFASMAVPGAGWLLSAGISAVGGAAGGKMAWKGWSWIRDNVLDQHGCYIQYLNRNGQAMDAGLNQSGQGMVVGRYHTKKLLPGILGVSSKVRTDDGYSYIRTDDLLKNLGWKEKDITGLVRYISFENALVNTQILKYSGTGPENMGLNRYFKVICRVTRVLDGDTIEVYDIFDKNKNVFRVRFDGINTPELNIIKTDIDSSGITASLTELEIVNNQATFTTAENNNFESDSVAIVKYYINNIEYTMNGKVQHVYANGNIVKNKFKISTPLPNLSKQNTYGTATVYTTGSGQLINPKSPGGKSTLFTQNAIDNKLIVLRISPNTKRVSASMVEDSYEAGMSEYNNPNYYEKDVFGSRTLATIYYKVPSYVLDEIIQSANAIFDKNPNSSFASISKSAELTLIEKLGQSLELEPFKTRYKEIEDSIPVETLKDYVSMSGSNKIKNMSDKFKYHYNRYIEIKKLNYIYEKISEWPNVEWDEYYEDGTAISLNWELVTENLANVYTSGLLIESPSVITASEMAAIPTRVNGS